MKTNSPTQGYNRGNGTALGVGVKRFVSAAVVPTAQLTMEETRYNEVVQAVKTEA